MEHALPDGDTVLARILGSAPGVDQTAKLAASKGLKKKREQELRMWKEWKDAGEPPEKLKPLLDSFRPVLKKQVNVYKGMVPIPPSVLEAEFKTHMVDGFSTYDPKYGTQLNTHVQNRMKKGRRFVVKYQNVGGIPEQRAYTITECETAKAERENATGREPSALELSDKLKWNVREVERMEAERRHMAVPTSAFKGPEGQPFDPSFQMPSREMELVRLMPAMLPPEQRTVFEYTFGLGGKPTLRPGEIAKKTGMNASKVSRIRKQLTAKMQEYYGGLD